MPFSFLRKENIILRMLSPHIWKYMIILEGESSLYSACRGSVQRQIEGDMGVKIVFPSSKEDSCIGKDVNF